MVWTAIVFIAIGAVLIWVGWTHWRYGSDDNRKSLIDAALMRGEEPLSKTRRDRILNRIQAVLGLTFGPILVLLGLVILTA